MNIHWHKLLTLLVSALVVLGLVTVSAAAVSAHSATKVTKAPTGIIKFSDWQFPDTLNPFEAGLATDYEEINLTMPLGYALYYDPHAKLLPGFLTQVPTMKNGGISKDGKTITFHIRPGLRWSDGQEITSADAKFAWEIEMDPQISLCTATCDNIASISTPNKYTFVWHMKHVYAAAIPIAWTGFAPHGWSKLAGGAHKAAAVESDPNFTYEDSSYVTAGPYQVSQFVSNDKIVLTPMKYYHAMGGPPRVAQYIFVFYSDKDVMIAAAARHETDLTQDYTLADLPKLLAHKSAFTTKYTSALSPEHLELNMLDKTVNGQPNPLVNLKVRQAINLAIDRYGIQASAFGVKNHKVACASISYDAPWVETCKIKQLYANPAINGIWDPLRHKYVQYGSQSVADAKALLKGTPCANGCTINAITTSGNAQRLAELSEVASNLHKIGITLTISTASAGKVFGTWQENGILAHGDFEMALFAYVGVPPDPDPWKENMVSRFINRLDPHHTIIDSNNAGLRDKLVDKAFTIASHTYNTKVRRLWYYRAQVEISKQVPWITLSVRPIFVTYDSHVIGVKINGYANGGADQWNAYEWRAGAA
jgi:peptide/nickel transport system substrate-binding protein